MIVCISLNPALDRRLYLPSLIPGEIHRARSASVAAGGKAAHVAMVARALGEPVMWIGMTGGAAGEQCLRQLQRIGIDAIAVTTQTNTRTNLEIVEETSGRVTEIRENGEGVSEVDVAAFVQRCAEVLCTRQGVCVVLSGSLPPRAPAELYATLIREIHAVNGTALLDASGDALALALPAEPDVVKPNLSEAAELVGEPVNDPLVAAEALRARGARSVALSLGERGLVWLGRNGQPVLGWSTPIRGRSTVGCGDATLAGIAVGFERRLPKTEMIRLAVACGAANCYAEMPALLRTADVERLAATVVIDPCARSAQRSV